MLQVTTFRHRDHCDTSRKLNLGRTLELKRLFTIRNIFHYCFEGKNPNGLWPTYLYTEEAWPFGVNNELAWTLFWRRREPLNFFYTIYNIPPYRWFSSTLGFRGELSGRNLVESVIDFVVTTACPTHPLIPS